MRQKRLTIYTHPPGNKSVLYDKAGRCVSEAQDPLPRLRRWEVWLLEFAPEWPVVEQLCWWLGGLLTPINCRLYGHVLWVEMDGKSVCCTWCAKKLGELAKEGEAGG